MNFILICISRIQEEICRRFKLEFNKKVEDFINKFPKKSYSCGDFNVAHNEIDIARPKDNRKNAGLLTLNVNG